MQFNLLMFRSSNQLMGIKILPSWTHLHFSVYNIKSYRLQHVTPHSNRKKYVFGKWSMEFMQLTSYVCEEIFVPGVMVIKF